MIKKIYSFLEKKNLLKTHFRISLLILLDSLIILFSIALTKLNFIEIEFNIIFLSIYFLIIGIPLYVFTNQYKSITKFRNVKHIYKIFLRNILLILIVFILSYFSLNIPFRIFIQTFLIITISSFLLRLFIKDLLNYIANFNNKKKQKVIIYGAGSAGVQLANSIKISNDYEILAFVDDSKELWNRSIFDIKIISPDEIIYLVNKIDKVLLAIPSLNKKRTREIVESLKRLRLNIFQIPSLEDLTSGILDIRKIKPVDIEDLLGREEINQNNFLPNHNIKNKVILITGAGGSIGSELCRKLLKSDPTQLILFDSSEENLYKIEYSLSKLNKNKTLLVPLLGNVLDEKLISIIFKKYKINFVFHAAAYKHVPLVEDNKISGIYNNVFSTKIICKYALINKIDQLVLISSDKAVRPTNIMGASKRLSELIVQAYSKLSEIQSQKINHKVIFSMVRFGNVLGSSGSVIPLFKKQINDGGPITITHPEITRYFMTISEAANLVIQSIQLSKGGDLFLLDMGEPIKIKKVAEQLINLSGLELKDKNNEEGDIEIKYVGLRPGEKLYEELLINSESIPTTNPLIYRAYEEMIEPDLLMADLDKLEKELKVYNEKNALVFLKKLVKEWEPKLLQN